MNVMLRCILILLEIKRAKVSTPPPGATGTTMRMLPLGKPLSPRPMFGATTALAAANIASRRLIRSLMGNVLNAVRTLVVLPGRPRAPLFDHLVGAGEQRWRLFQTK